MTQPPNDLEALAAKLEILIAEATDEDLADGGRYFYESCRNFTSCNHGDTGEYGRSPDGKLVQLLWNNRATILTALRTQDAVPVAGLGAPEIWLIPEQGDPEAGEWTWVTSLNEFDTEEVAHARHYVRAHPSPNPAPQAGAAEGVAWRPIKTAPKDGTPILVIWYFGDDDGHMSHDIARWCGWWDSHGFTLNEPTHWMPLPTHPSPNPAPQAVAAEGELPQPLSQPVPTRIWLLDLGCGEITWCDDPDPDGEQIDAVEYIRTDARPTATNGDKDAVTRNDWTTIAKAAGKHGIRYRTNSALVKFLNDIGLLANRGEAV